MCFNFLPPLKNFEMPTHLQHIVKPHKPTHVPKLAKELQIPALQIIINNLFALKNLLLFL